MMGELWHKLTDDLKEDYRKRAKVVTDQKLKDWQAKLAKLSPAQQRAVQRIQGGHGAAGAAQAMAQGQQGQAGRRRRAHAYAVFSSEMRKTMGIMGNKSDVPINEVTRIIAEKWRDLDAGARKKYEDRANMINAQEERRYAAQQQQQHRQMALTQQRQQMMQRSPQSQGGSGLRIASVSSLQQQPKSSPVSLPSSITISRVQNEQPQVRQIQQRLPSGTQLTSSGGGAQRGRPGPANAAGMPGMPQGGRGAMMRQAQMNRQQMMAMQAARQGQRPRMPGQMHNLNGAGVKRPVPVDPSMMAPGMKRPRMMGHQGASPGSVPPRMCRLCGINTTAYQKLSTRTDVLEVMAGVVGFRVDPDQDKREGYPINVCRKCTALVLTCDKFKKTVEEGQVKL